MGEGGRRPDEGTFAAAISNIYSFIEEPSPALSGTLSHAYRTGEGNNLQRCQTPARLVTQLVMPGLFNDIPAKF
jgi:hypothetical protein